MIMLASCYTATESTPKIDDTVLKNIEKSEEELIMENNFVKRGCQTWLPGKAFAYVDDGLSPVLRPEENASLSAKGLKGKTFLYEGYREENLYGNKSLVTLVFRCDSSIYTYSTGKSMDEIAAMDPLLLIGTRWLRPGGSSSASSSISLQTNGTTRETSCLPPVSWCL